MIDFKSLYDKGPTSEDIASVEKALNNPKGLNDWKDYYWGAKILCDFDPEEFDGPTCQDAMNAAIKYGLTLRQDKECYLDAMQVLAVLDSQQGNYASVENHLGAVLDCNENAPDWVYREYVYAEIHNEDSLKRLLNNPSFFINDLKKNTDNSEDITDVQRKIYKEFLGLASDYCKKHYGTKVALDSFGELADFYSLRESDSWKKFYRIAGGNSSEVLVDEQPVVETDYVGGANDAVESGDRPFVVSIYPDERAEKNTISTSTSLVESVDYELEYEKTKAELEEVNHTLEEAKKALEDKDKEYSDQYNKWKNFEAAVQASPEKDIRMHMHEYIYDAQVYLSRFLGRCLPLCNDDWWTECVIEKLSYDQRRIAFEQKFTSLEDMDFVALIRILDKNWNRIQHCANVYFAEEDFEQLEKIKAVRNRWAHEKTALPEEATVKDDLLSISEFLILVRCGKEKRSEVEQYARKLPKLYKETKGNE